MAGDLSEAFFVCVLTVFGTNRAFYGTSTLIKSGIDGSAQRRKKLIFLDQFGLLTSLYNYENMLTICVIAFIQDTPDVIS